MDHFGRLTTAQWLAGVKSASKTLSQRLPASGLKIYSSNMGDTRDVGAHETLTPSELMEVVHEAANLDRLDGIAMSIPSELAAADGKAKRVYVIDGVEQVLERLQDEAFVLLLSPREFDKLVALRVNELPVLLAHTPRKS